MPSKGFIKAFVHLSQISLYGKRLTVPASCLFLNDENVLLELKGHKEQMDNLNILPDENEYHYIYRICSQKEKIGNWNKVAKLLNKQLCHDYNESTYRKKWEYFNKMLEGNQDIFSDSEQAEKKLNDTLLELKKERAKINTEKNELNRWVRESAKDELFWEKAIDAIRKNESPCPAVKEIVPRNRSKCAVLNIADMHFGKEFKIYGVYDEIINEYSPEIFFYRMERLLNETVAYIQQNNISHLKVFNLGDSLDGFLRNSQAWTLRYGVIDSAVIFGKYMGRWLNQLSKYTVVEYYQTVGNHGELRLLDGTKGQHTSENIEKITGEFIRYINENNHNFSYCSNKSGLIFSEIVGFNVLGIHGEIKDLEEALREYSDIYDAKISYLIAGHKHNSSFKNCGVRKGIIGVGSIVGSDDFSIQLRRTADATASLIVFEEGLGKIDEHIFVLN